MAIFPSMPPLCRRRARRSLSPGGSARARFGEKSVSEAIAAHAGASVEEASVEYDDPCWFFFTSGTTGRSKAAVLTHGQMAFVVTNHLADLMPGTTER